MFIYTCFFKSIYNISKFSSITNPYSHRQLLLGAFRGKYKGEYSDSISSFTLFNTNDSMLYS